MSQKIRRGGTGARKVARRQGTQARVRQTKKQASGAMGAAIRFLPFTEEQLQRVFLAIILGGAAALAWFVASLAGVPAMAQQQLANLAGDAGFEVKNVEVRGTERMNVLTVYERVLGEQDQAMPLVDVEALRAELLDLDWVRDARVSRQLPDTLVIDIVERVPHAVLRKPGRLVLIDATGHALEPISAANAKPYLMIEGPGAQRQVPALATLLEAAPALKPQVAEAEWVGNRRWDITFKTDQVLALPEGEEASAKALMSFARLDGVNRLLGGKVASFDMRAPERIYMRCPGCGEGEGEDLATGEGEVRSE
ncbi:cell division protein FtsQ/DivIB [Alteriqipengyuania sp. WL0013]|uniref:cell division protein FtsQ/DivIB n=1 Tax=Alteriqipengyuania sp. WL0013 TaxID=3110773 RepID=UPI002CAA0D93|nr:cell division protein FtsQ/DivIB [Alteriqipengyuania sp. WL0013]MEB3415791.1 cell division protein FtsQ/DivIB [Alteriqipengyuania sp. WL0013]